MKSKILLSVMFGLLVNANAFAVEIYKGQLVNHKEWSTHNVQLNVMNGKNSLAQMKHVTVKDSDGSSFVFLQSLLPQARGKVGSVTTVDSTNGMFIQNLTDTSQTYLYGVSLCSSADGRTNECGYYQDQYQLDPQGYVMLTPDIQVLIPFTMPGTYQSTLTATISGNEDTSPLSMSMAIGAITIS